MSGAVSHGADADRLDEIAGQLQQEAERLGNAGTQGSAMLVVLRDSWSGPDLEAFDCSWSGAHGQIEQATQRLRTAVADLRRQAADQRGASDAKGVPGSSSPGPESEGPVSPDANDARDDDNLLDRLVRFFNNYYNDKQDPGEHNVTLPEGADENSPMIQDMLRTPSGRAALDWMARNEIKIIVDEDHVGAVYDAGQNAMIIGPGYQDAGTIVHETSHAQWDAEDRPIGATEASKEEYLDNRLRDESEAVAASIQFAKEERANGDGAPPDQAELDYDAAYEAAIASGKSEEQAHDAGVDAIQDLFESGVFTTSNTQQTYTEYYGEYWESVN